jgi:hypothetical protein
MIITTKMLMTSQQISLLISWTEKRTFQSICTVIERIEMLHQDITLPVLYPSIELEVLTSLTIL